MAHIPTKYNVTILYLSFSRLIIPEIVVMTLAFYNFTEFYVPPEELMEEVK